MPLEFGDGDEAGGPERRRARLPRFEEPRGPWWRPRSTGGRVFLGLVALAVLGGITTAGLLLKTYLERDARFRIAGTDDIQATGLTEVSRSQMLEVFGEDIGRNIFFVPLAERRRQLEKIPWVEQATVMRLLPDQVHVSIVERRPVAFARNGNDIGLVDASGVLLPMTPAAMAEHHYSFPVLTGIDPRDSAEARRTRIAVYLRLMSELDAGGQRNSEQISEIDLTDPEDARVTMPEQGADILAHFGEDHFLERYQRFEAHIAEWRQQYPHLASVDLRYDHQVVLEMAPETVADAKPPAGELAAKPPSREKKTRLADRKTVKTAAETRKRQATRQRSESRRAASAETRRKPNSRPARSSERYERPAPVLVQGG